MRRAGRGLHAARSGCRPLRAGGQKRKCPLTVGGISRRHDLAPSSALAVTPCQSAQRQLGLFFPSASRRFLSDGSALSRRKFLRASTAASALPFIVRSEEHTSELQSPY